jgi:hypothetical protein
MRELSTLLRYEIWFLLIGLATVVAYQLLTGLINTRGLLDEKAGDRRFSPAQLQLLLFTVGGAFYYLLLVIDNPNPGTFPDVPSELLLVLGGSHVFYQTGNLSSLLRQKFGSLLSGAQAGNGDHPKE